MRLTGAPGSWERGLNPTERKVSVCVLAFYALGVLDVTVSLVEVGGLFVVRVSVVSARTVSSSYLGVPSAD